MRNTIILSLALLSFAAVCTHAAVMGIDFGSEFIKVAAVKPGVGFHVVLDEQTKRKIPAIVGLDNDERFFGNDATGLMTRKPQSTFAFAHRLLGKTIKSPEIQRFKDAGFPYEIVELPGRNGAVGIKYDKEITFAAEELVAMNLAHVKRLAEADLKVPVKDCVLTVPHHFTQVERQAVIDAAELAGLNVLSLINENTAAAVQYGIDRKYNVNETHTAIFYNMGTSSTKVILATYSAYIPAANKKTNRTVGQVEIRSSSWDETLGGQAFDLRITDFLVEQFQKVLKKAGDSSDVRTIPKVMAKLRRQAEEIKRVLSANQETPISIGSVYNDLDLKTHLTREQFYSLSADLLERLVKPLAKVLEDAKVEPSQLDAVVIIGGSTRIPGVQKAIKQFLKRDSLDQNLNGDEAPAFGAAFRAANLSTAFQVRPLGLIDITPFPVGVRFSDLPVEGVEISEENKLSKRTSLFKRNNHLMKKKTVTLSHDKDLLAVIQHDSAAETLPTDASVEVIGYEVRGVPSIVSSSKWSKLLNDSKPKLNLVFQLDPSGMSSLVKAEVAIDETVQVPAPKKAGTKATKNETASSAEEKESKSEEKKAEGEQTESTQSSSEEKATDDKADSADKAKTTPVEYVSKKITHRIPLEVVRRPAANAVAPMNETHRKSARDTLTTLQRRDDERKEISFAKNSVESFIYDTRSTLEDDDVVEVSTEDERENIRTKLAEAEDWLLEHSSTQAAAPFQAKLKQLQTLTEGVNFRLEQLASRPEAVNNAKEVFKGTKTILEQLAKERPWVTEDERADLQKLVSDASQWLEEKEAAQEAQPMHKTPVFTAEEVIAKIRPIAKLAQQYMRKPKPKETPKPKNETASANTTSAAKNGTEIPKAETTDSSSESSSSSSSSSSSETPKTEETKTEEARKEEL